MAKVQIQSDIIHIIMSSTIRTLSPKLHLLSHTTTTFPRLFSTTSFSLRAFSTQHQHPVQLPEKPPICTADKLHYVSVPDSDWHLALWRYHPSPQAPSRNHPLLLLSGVGTNAIGYDLSPASSFARYMSVHGFDTWILEVRGTGLSVRGSNVKEIEQSANAASEQMEAVDKGAINGVISSEWLQNDYSSGWSDSEVFYFKEDPTGMTNMWDESKLVSKLTETFMRLSERLSGFLSEGQSKIMSAELFDQISTLFEDSQLSERFNEIRGKLLSLLDLKTRQDSNIAGQIRDLSERLVNISVSPQLFDLQERLFSTIEDFQKQLDLIVKYDWDFDNYLEQDVPAAMEYIKAQCKPTDGKLLAIGHSMGGILLYAKLSQCGKDPMLAAVVTLASSLDYTSSKSTLKLLLPLADPAQALNVPVVPLGTLLAAAYPLSSRPPYVVSWLNQLISADDMLHPELLKKLVLNNFFTIPAKLILQLTTAFREGGLCDRSGRFFYKDHLHKSNVPVLALVGDQDLICPPEAVE
ncbi:LOW QUALITY PROTEIN: Abhydrolase_6 domain-containing protein, partial [Cephalotus follicularis]